MKKEDCTQIVPTAEVRLGDYVAKFTEENLEYLKDVADFARESARESIMDYDEFIIEWYNQNHKDADRCMTLLDGLRGLIVLFDYIGKIDIKREKSNL